MRVFSATFYLLTKQQNKMKNYYNILLTLSIMSTILFAAVTAYDLLFYILFDTEFSLAFVYTIMSAFLCVLFSILAVHRDAVISQKNYEEYKGSRKQ